MIPILFQKQLQFHLLDMSAYSIDTLESPYRENWTAVSNIYSIHILLIPWSPITERTGQESQIYTLFPFFHSNIVFDHFSNNQPIYAQCLILV